MTDDRLAALEARVEQLHKMRETDSAVYEEKLERLRKDIASIEGDLRKCLERGLAALGSITDLERAIAELQAKVPSAPARTGKRRPRRRSPSRTTSSRSAKAAPRPKRRPR